MGKSRSFAILFGVFILVFFLVVPPFEPLTKVGMRIVGVFLCTICWWIFVGVSYPSIMSLVLLIVTGVMTPKEVFSSSFGHWLVLFLIGCFGLCEALKSSGFTNRFTLWFLSRPYLKNRPWILMTSFFLACTLMGSVMSSTATCIVFMAIARSIFKVLKYEQGNLFASFIMIGIAWASTASMAMTPIAHAPNLLMMEWIKNDFGYTIRFLDWMKIGVPMGLFFCFLLVGFFKVVMKPDVSKFTLTTADYAKEELQKLGPMSLQETISLVVFLFVFFLWIGPDFFGVFSPRIGLYLVNLGYATPALFGATLLCFITVKNKEILSFNQWFFQGVEWGSVVLVAAIMAIGSLIGSPKSGIPQFLTGFFVPLTENLPPFLFVFLVVLWVTLQTNVMSNIVSMTLVYSIMIPISVDVGFENPVALGVTIAAASSYAFLLPPATTATALVVGSGWASPKQMLQFGAYLVLPTIILFAFVFYNYAGFLLR